MYTLIFLFLVSLITVFVLIFTNHFLPFDGDGVVYYTHLPSFFIYKDLDLNFLSNFLDKTFIEHFCIYKFIKYPLGCAYLQMPFFLLAHFIMILFNKSLANGYSFIYQLFIQISTLFYWFIALILNYKILKNFVSKKIAQISLLAITFGTALFYYACFESTMSHIYAYFSITLFLYIVIKFDSNDYNSKKFFLLGLSLGLVAMIRNTNILVFLVYLFYGVKNFDDLKKKLFIFFDYKNLLFFMLGFLVFLTPQMLYWYNRTGYFLINSYHPEHYISDYPFPHDYDKFNFLNPVIFSTIFSLKKGLLVYYPVLIFSLFGFKHLSKYFSKLRFSIPIFIIIIIYLYSSFDGWHAGGSYGNRFYLDYMVFFSILIAAFFENISLKFSKKTYITFLSILFIFIIYTLFLNYLFFLGYSDEFGSFENYLFQWLKY